MYFRNEYQIWGIYTNDIRHAFNAAVTPRLLGINGYVQIPKKITAVMVHMVNIPEMLDLK